MSINNTDNTKRIAKNTFFLTFRMLLVMAVGLFTVRVIIQTLGVEDYGVYNVVGGVVIIFSFIQNAMINSSNRYFAIALGEDDIIKLRRTFAMSVNVHIIIAGLIFLLSETVGLWFLNNKLVFPDERLFAANMAYQFSIITFCFNILRTPFSSLILANEHMNFYARTSIVEVLLQLVTVYCLILLPYDKLIIYSALLCFVAFSILIWYYAFCRKRYNECYYERFWDTKLLKDMLSYSTWSITVHGVDIAVNQCMVFFFNIFGGVAVNAALGVANQASSQVLKFVSSFTQAVNPQIVKTYARGDMAYLYKVINSTAKLSYYIFIAVLIPLLLNLNFLLSTWLGVVPENTGIFIFFTCLFFVFDTISQPLWMTVYATGNLRTHQILMSCIKLLNIPLAYFMLKIGVEAWSALAIKAALNMVCSIVRPIYMVRLIKFPLRPYYREVIFRCIIVSAISVPIPTYIAMLINDGWGKLIITSITFLLLLCLTVLIFGLNTMEKGLIINVINRILRRQKDILQ